MGGPTYDIDVKHVEAVKNDIMSTAGQIRSELDTLDANLKSYLEFWFGADFLAYGAYKEKWSGLITEMNDVVLPKAAKALDDMIQNVVTTERNNLSMW